MFGLDSMTIVTIIAGILCLMAVMLLICIILLGKQSARHNKLCQDSDYLNQKLPEWIKGSVAASIAPELLKLRNSIDNYAKIAGESQAEALQEIVNSFIASMDKKVEESATQYEMRIAQSTEHLNNSLGDINTTVSVALTDALSGFDSELQATLTELLGTMKKMRATTNNIPRVIDNSFTELQRSFDEMETEMQKTINAFRDMRTKIEKQQQLLGPVDSSMLRADTPIATSNSTAENRKQPEVAADTTPQVPTPNKTTEEAQPSQNKGGLFSKFTKRSSTGSMNFSDY